MTLEFLPQRKAIIGLFFAVLALYVIFQARNLLAGPQLTITYPKDNETISGPVIEVGGTAKNISFITLNDKQIYVDDQGKFKESLLPSSGLVILKLIGKDRFGRQKIVSENIVVNE